MLVRMCCPRESVAVAEAEALERGPLEQLVGSDRWRSIGPQLLRSRLVPGSGPWYMDHMSEARVHDHQHLYCLMLDWTGEVCGSRRQSCRFRDTDCSRYRIGHDADGR